MAKSFKEMLVESGQELEFQSGGKAPDHLVDREIKWEPHPRIAKLKGIYMDSLSSTNNEFPYWYTREYFQGDNEILLRRADRPFRDTIQLSLSGCNCKPPLRALQPSYPCL